MSESADAVVIGAGILGASIAHFLVKRELGTVVLLDKGPICSGATAYSAANVRQHYSNEIGIRLAVRAVEMFENSDEWLGGPCGFVRCGYMVIAPQDEADAIQRVVPLQQRLGVQTRIVGPEEINELFPQLELTDIALGCLETNSGYADPTLTVRSLVLSAQSEGLLLYEGRAARDIEIDGGRVTAVDTPSGKISTPVVVNAAGPWADRVGAMAGVEYDLVFSREHEAVFDVPEAGDLPIVSDAVNRIFFRPNGEGTLLLGEGYPKEIEPCDPETYDDRADNRVIRRAVESLISRVPRLRPVLRASGADKRTVRSYSGVYSITKDWYPIVGPVETLDGYYAAVGGSGHSFKIGPPIGEALAAMIAGDEPGIDLSSLRHTRFEERDLFSSVWGPGNRA
jgi:sarcosine oxidase subunit beta